MYDMRYAKPPKNRSERAQDIFVNEDGSPLTEADVDQITIGTLRRNGAHPAFIFAYEKVGFLVSESNWQKWSAEDLAAWEAALVEYERQHPDAPALPSPRRIRLVDIGFASN